MINFLQNYLISCVIWLQSVYELLMPFCGLISGIFLPLFCMAVSSKRSFLAELHCYIILAGAFPLLIPFISNCLMFFVDDRYDVQNSAVNLISWCGAAIIGLLFVFIFGRWLWPAAVDRIQYWLKPSNRERGKRTDARTVQNTLPPPIAPFSPADFFCSSKGVFVGLDENQKPIYISENLWRESHIQLTGRTRVGKGVAAQTLLSQAVMKHEFVMVLDPKGDKWLPSVLQQAAKQAGVPYNCVDLSPTSPAQINPFADMDAEDAENALLAAFSLSDKGEAADFYRINDRRAALDCARLIDAEKGATARRLFEQHASRWEDDSKGFAEALRELADLAAINANSGSGLIDIARNGGVLYVIGDMENSRVLRAQRLLLIRLQQIAKRRGLHEISTPFMVFADEFRVHISRPFITALAVSAGWGLRCILAFQSYQDLSLVPGDLSAEAVKGAVAENCAISLSYRLKDPDTAEWIAKSTGTILVDDEVREIQANWAMAETVESTRSVRQAERFRVDVNQLLNLPKGCGVLLGALDQPLFCFTAPINVEIKPEASRPSFKPDTDESAVLLPLAQEAIQL